MGRKKRAIGQAWNAINKQRDEESKKQQAEFKEKHKETPEEKKAKEDYILSILSKKDNSSQS